MNPEAAELLSRLRDIHAAPDAPWWPPAPGWWILAVFVAAGLFWLIHSLGKGLRARARRRLLLGRLDGLRRDFDPARQPREYLAAVNQLLKLVALRACPGAQCAALKGRDWVAFLQTGLDDGSAAFEALAHGPYQPAPAFDVGALERSAAAWIERHG